MPDPNQIVLKKETYLKMVENSPGSRMFNSVYVLHKDTGKIEDILHDGEFSCATFVSSVLFVIGMTDAPCVTVDTMRKKLASDLRWKQVNGFENVEPGDVVFWEKIKFADGSENEHVGFALNKNEAVSTSDTERKVVRHDLACLEKSANNKPRAITSLFRYNF
ncbi:MAG: hypothetical protein WC797_01720 [Candidatus Paceibacterota bacterium]|jgi:hypothetical protein